MSKEIRAKTQPLRNYLLETFRKSIPSVDKKKGRWGETTAGLSMVLFQEPNKNSVTESEVIQGLKDYTGKSCRSDQAIKTCMRHLVMKGLLVTADGRKSSANAVCFITFPIPGDLLNVQQD